jgi:hypothetical protein
MQNLLSEKQNQKFFLEDLIHDIEWLDFVAFACSTWLFIYPYPYKLLFCILLFIPFLGLILNRMAGNSGFDSLIKKVKDKNGNDTYMVAYYINIVSWTVGIKVFIDFEFENIYSIFIHGSVAFIMIAFILFITHHRITGPLKTQLSMYGLLLLNILLYSYGGTYGINCLFDDSKPYVFQTHIIEKHINHHRKSADTYTVTVSPWGHHFDNESISVSSEQYNRLIEGQAVSMDVKSGLFDIPWYYIDDAEQQTEDW